MDNSRSLMLHLFISKKRVRFAAYLGGGKATLLAFGLLGETAPGNQVLGGSGGPCIAMNHANICNILGIPLYTPLLSRYISNLVSNMYDGWLIVR